MKIIGHSTKKNLLKIMIILGIILIIELIVFFAYKLIKNKNDGFGIQTNQYIDVINIDDGYITVGYNYYEGTEDVKYNNDLPIKQGEITKFDNSLNIVWTTRYYLDNNVELVGITKIKDGYIIIGNETKEKGHSEEDNTGILLKVDKEGQIVKATNYDLLENTLFNKIVRDNNKNIIIGYSQYELDRVGNHLGGGIILKVDDDLNIIEQNNYGGNKSGTFNNIFILKDSYLVTGKDAEYPVIVKFNKDFNRDDDDTELISKKVIYNKTLDNSKEFNPRYYNDNKLYDNEYYYDIENDKLETFDKNKVLKDKHLLLIDKEYVYASTTNKLYIYNHDFELVKEYTVDTDYIETILPIKDQILLIVNKCEKEKCYFELKIC